MESGTLTQKVAIEWLTYCLFGIGICLETLIRRLSHTKERRNVSFILIHSCYVDMVEFTSIIWQFVWYFLTAAFTFKCVLEFRYLDLSLIYSIVILLYDIGFVHLFYLTKSHIWAIVLFDCLVFYWGIGFVCL